MQIFPVPLKFTKGTGTRNMSGCMWITLPYDSGFPLKKRVMEMAVGLKAAFMEPPRVSAGKPSAGELLIEMTRIGGMGDEEYKLTLSKKGAIAITASGDAGFFYGMQTALQLIADPKSVPCCTISDKPAMRERGYMLDISRNKVPTMDTVKSIVRSLAKLRYNSMQLYMEHTFAYAAHERAWAGYTPFTSEEIMELDAFCREYFIELVPNMNSFGHMERWLKYADYRGHAECNTREHPQCLYPGKESAEFMDSLYAELLPNFTAHKLNIGCDETWELGKGRSEAECRKKGTTQVYLNFLTQLSKKATDRGFSVEFWGDIIMHNPELICKLPKGITALEWGYEYNHKFKEDTLQFKKSGIDFLVCPGTSTWQSIIGRTTNMEQNVSNAMLYGSKNGARGFLMTDWGDGGHHQYFPISWPGLTLGGGASWNATSKETLELLPYGISMAFAPGKDGIRLGKFIMEAGRIYDHFKDHINNSTQYGRILLCWRDMKKSDPNCPLNRTSRAEISKAKAHTEKMLDMLKNEPFDNALVNAELENGLRMAHAMLVLLNRMLGGKWERNAWENELAHIVAKHEELWLSRNRSGGLHESSQILRDVMSVDPNAWLKR